MRLSPEDVHNGLRSYVPISISPLDLLDEEWLADYFKTALLVQLKII